MGDDAIEDVSPERSDDEVVSEGEETVNTQFGNKNETDELVESEGIRERP